MSTSKFLIGPIKEGLRKDIKPYATPEDSFQVMTNALQWRGRTIRREGYTTLGQLSTDGGTTFPGNPVMGLATQELFGIGQQALIAFDTQYAYSWNGTVFTELTSVMSVTWTGSDSQFFWTTNYANAFWATNNKPLAGLNGVAITNVTALAGTITVTAVNNFSSGQTVVLINIGDSSLTGGFTALNGKSFLIVTASPTQFTFSSTVTGTYSSGGMALNSEVTQAGQDGIKYYGQLSNGTGWANYNPPIDTNNALAGALMIFPYRGYLVFLNTIEGNDGGVKNYGQRARWCQLGTPYYSVPNPIFPNTVTVDVQTMRSDLFGKGSFEDAQTNEVIVSAGFIRDILVVYFERSTWRLRYVNNAQDPFAWERVNQELGSSCTFSGLIFDKGLMTIGNRGIVISDSNDTVRFDEKIPDDIFNIRQVNNGLQRVYGIRTFRSKLTYWTYPSDLNPLGTYPDQVLVFNYETKNWSFFDDCFTCFGYYYPSSGQTWQNLKQDWSATTETWDGGQSEAGTEIIIAGNQQGFVLRLPVITNDSGTGSQNGVSLYISAINTGTGVVTSPNNNLPDGSWITITGTGITSTDGVSIDGRNFKISNPANDPNNFTLNEFRPAYGGSASGTSYTNLSNPIDWLPIIAGSIQINVGSIVFTDPNFDGVLVGVGGVGGTGEINYTTGVITLTFNSSISTTPAYIRLVAANPAQILEPVGLIGTYTPPGGFIAKISGYDVQSKIFNFFKDDQKSRLSYIDFYVDKTSVGQFTCNIWADSSNYPANTPLSDNYQSNVVRTTNNPYQVSDGDQTIFRLFADVNAQTLQCQFTLSDRQMAINELNTSQIGIVAMMFSLRRAGRLM